MTARRSLIDPFRQAAHVSDPFGDLLPEQHAAAAGFCALADHDLDSVGFAQIVRIHPIARWQHLIDQGLGVRPLFLRHAAVARRRRRSGSGRAAAQRFLCRTGQSAETHPGNRDRNLQMNRPLREAGADGDVGRTFFAISLERISAHRRAEKQQVVEMRQPALGSAAADIVNTRCRRAPDFRNRIIVKCRGFSRNRMLPVIFRGHQYNPILSTWK